MKERKGHPLLNVLFVFVMNFQLQVQNSASSVLQVSDVVGKFWIGH